MTPKERAEKICEILIGKHVWPTEPDLVKITAQIEEAEREAVKEFYKVPACELASAFEAGFRAAREKAKGIAESFQLRWEDHESPSPARIADRIAAMTPDETKEGV